MSGTPHTSTTACTQWMGSGWSARARTAMSKSGTPSRRVDVFLLLKRDAEDSCRCLHGFACGPAIRQRGILSARASLIPCKGAGACSNAAYQRHEAGAHVLACSDFPHGTCALSFDASSSTDIQPRLDMHTMCVRVRRVLAPAAECLHSWRPNPAGSEIPINCCCVLPKSDHILVCDRSSTGDHPRRS